MGVRAILDARGLRPQKKWGQHFLTDARILESIADAADVSPTDTILEIGPGLGHLTRALARRAGRVIAIEIDGKLATKLQDEFSSVSNVAIVQGNVLDARADEWIERYGNQITGAGKIPAPVNMPFKVVANLPYYITSAILRHLLQTANKPSVIVVMVQREVAQRMIAQPPAMNLLAIGVQFFARPRIVRTIAAGAFYPPPQVDSAVVRLDVFPEPRLGTSETEEFFEIVHAGFGERRKQLFNALRHRLSDSARLIAQALANAGIDPTRRAETLTLPEWLALYHTFLLSRKGK